MATPAMEAIREKVIAEMTTKLAWAVASTLHVAYGRKSFLRSQCIGMAEDMYDRKLEWMDKK